MAEREPLPPIKFEALADALLGRIDTLIDQWLPGGKVQGNEYFVHSFWRSEKTPSLSVCMKGSNAGRWQDHGGEHKGGDLTSLYAAIHGMSNGAAAVELARQLGLEDVAGVLRARPDTPQPERAAPTPAPVAQQAPTRARDDEGWATVAPVPEHASAATFWHKFRQVADIVHTAKYVIDGALHGYVVRFRKSDGGKETLPYTWCTSARDGGSVWKWRTWDEPRPLYFPGGKSPAANQTVILVEGERKADVLQALLDAGAPGVYVVVGWPGGSKAWKKANWAWLKGAHVLAWPDCDGKREQLTNAEKQATPDPLAQIALQQAKPLLPAHKQVGMVAMLGIGAHLRDEHACTVQLLPIPAPGAVADGWDCADAIEVDGWDFDKVMALFAQAQALPQAGEAKADAEPAAEKKRYRPVDTGDGGDAPGGDLVIGRRVIPWWLACYYDKPNKRWLASRKMVIADPGKRTTRRCSDVLAYNELSNNVQARVAWPWAYAKAGDVTRCGGPAAGQVPDRHAMACRASARAALARGHPDSGAHAAISPHPRLCWRGLQWDQHRAALITGWCMCWVRRPDTLSKPMLEYFGRSWAGAGCWAWCTG